MSDLHVFDDTRRGSAIAVYLERCDLLLEQAFLQNYDVRQAFRVWLEPRFLEQGEAGVAALLHDEPIYVIGRYLGIPHTGLPPDVLGRAKKLAIKHHW